MNLETINRFSKIASKSVKPKPLTRSQLMKKKIADAKAKEYNETSRILEAQMYALNVAGHRELKLLNENLRDDRLFLAKQRNIAMSFSAATRKAYKFKINTCKQRRVEFRLTIGQFDEILKRTHCEYTGVAFTNENKPTIERVNPKIGYEYDNCIAATAVSNNVKAKLDDFIHVDTVDAEAKIKMLRKALYQLEKSVK